MHKRMVLTMAALLLPLQAWANQTPSADAMAPSESTGDTASATDRHSPDPDAAQAAPSSATTAHTAEPQHCPACASTQGQEPSCTDTPPRSPQIDAAQLATAQMMAGVLASLVAVPSAYLIGGAIGTLSPNLLAAGLPALAVAALLPPVAVTAASWLYGGWLADDPGSLWWTLAATSATHLAAMTGGALLKVSSTKVESLLLLSASEALVLPITATTTLSLTRDDGDQP